MLNIQWWTLRIEAVKKRQLYSHFFVMVSKTYILMQQGVNHNQYVRETMLQILNLTYKNNILDIQSWKLRIEALKRRQLHNHYSGTQMINLTHKKYTAAFCMDTRVILWCIWNHCIVDSIDLHNVRAVNFLQKSNINMSKYYFSRCQIFLSYKVWKLLSLYNKNAFTQTQEAWVAI